MTIVKRVRTLGRAPHGRMILEMACFKLEYLGSAQLG